MTNANVVTWAGRSIYNNLVGGAGSTGYLQGGAPYLATSNGSGSVGLPKFIGWGNSVGATITGSQFSDVNLFDPVYNNLAGSENGVNRATGVITYACTSHLADTFIVTGTMTANGAQAITEVGLFDQAQTSPTTTLTVALANTAASQTVQLTANTNFPQGANNFYAQIGNEVVTVTQWTGVNATVTRAQLGSILPLASWPIGTPFTLGGDGGAYGLSTASSNSTWNASNTGATGAGGSMFVHADFPVINLANNDSIQFTLKVQLQ